MAEQIAIVDQMWSEMAQFDCAMLRCSFDVVDIPERTTIIETGFGAVVGSRTGVAGLIQFAFVAVVKNRCVFEATGLYRECEKDQISGPLLSMLSLRQLADSSAGRSASI
jgi:hypothetical protein